MKYIHDSVVGFIKKNKLQTEFINDYYLTVVVKEYYRNMRVCVCVYQLVKYCLNNQLSGNHSRESFWACSLSIPLTHSRLLSLRIPPTYPRRRRFGDHGSTCYFVFDIHARNWAWNNKYRPRRQFTIAAHTERSVNSRYRYI